MSARLRSPPPSSYSPVSPSETHNSLIKDGENSIRSSRSSFTFRSSGFKRVFALLGKDSSKATSPIPNSGGRRRGDSGSTRRDSESGVTRLPPSISASGNSGNTGPPGGGFLYRSRNARSMDALRIFTKSTSKPPPMPHHLSTVVSSGQRPKSTEKDLIPPVLRLQVGEEDEGNASQSTLTGGSTYRPSANGDIKSTVLKSAPNLSPTYSGIGGAPPPGALGAIATPATKITPPSPPLVEESPLMIAQKEAITRYEQLTAIHNIPPNARISTPPRPRVPKPNLSIPIPPPMTSHEKAATEPPISSPSLAAVSTSPTSTTNNHNAATIGPRPKMPPSPGLSFRLTPSIVMSRPIWPLPPLPNMDIPPVPPLPSSVTTSNSPTPTQTPKRPLFRLSHPSRTRTLPLGRSLTEAGPSGGSLGRARSERVSRSISVKLDSMPSLNVMGETEHGDPEADDDDMDGDDMEGDGDGDGDGDGEEEEEVVVDEILLGRPSIDSMISLDSVTSVETVRAPAENTTTSIVSPLDTPTVDGMGTIMDLVKRKGKGKETAVEPDEDAEHSDSDDSLYFDARDSVIVSPKDVPKMIERRRSQQRHPPSLNTNAAAAAVAARQSLQLPTPTARDQFIHDGSFVRDRTSLRDGSSNKRDSTWSMSTARESVYYTPTEGQSAFLTPHASAFTAGQELFMNTSTSAFAKEIAAKRASVPATFGIPLSNMTKDGTASRRGGENRFSMSRLTAERDGLPSVDLSTLNFDPSQFSAKTPTPGSGPGAMDGLPASRKDGMPNFDGIVPFTNINTYDESTSVTSAAAAAETAPRTPRSVGYFNDAATSKTGSATNSPSVHFRRGSISASISIPTSIAEDLPIEPATAEAAGNHERKSIQWQNSARGVQSAVLPSAGIALPLDLTSIRSSSSPSKANLDPQLSSLPHPHSPISFPSPSSNFNRPSTLNNAKRPSVYRQASKSMVELSLSSAMDGDSRKDEDYKGGLDSTETPALPSTAPVEVDKTHALESDPLSWVVPPPSPAYTRTINRQNGTIRRVSSFPLLQSSDMPISEKPPPEYHLIPRREEEGKEALPVYSNDIILAGLLPRKMEFDRPGFQARDRSWKKVWCVLQGTMFRIYKVGTLEVKFGALAAAPVAGSSPPYSATTTVSGGKVRGHGSSFSVSNIARSIVIAPIGASGGDARPRSPSVPQAPIRANVTSEASSWKAPLNDPSKNPDLILTKNQQLLAPPSGGLSSLAPSVTSGNARSSISGSSYAPSRSSFSHSRPSTPQSRLGGSSTTLSHSSDARSKESAKPTGHGPGGRSLIDNGGLDIYTPAETNLIRKYSLQNAESGLATDYLKRRNVIRVRLEGEQFLLQLPGVEDVVEWIEGLQASANIALDLDVRPMPKGALYPRRRRRRRNQPGEAAAHSGSHRATETPGLTSSSPRQVPVPT